MPRRVKELELRVLSELMKNSRMSDRELAKRLGVSQPTVSRARSRMEKDGFVKEYTLIPDYTKIGYALMAVTFIKRKKEYSHKDMSQVFEEANKYAKHTGLDTVMALRGMGLGYDAVVISLHENYATYQQRLREIKGFPYIDVEQTSSFIIDLKDPGAYRPLTFSLLAQHLLTVKR